MLGELLMNRFKLKKRTQAAVTAEGPVIKTFLHPHYTEGEGEKQDGKNEDYTG